MFMMKLFCYILISFSGSAYRDYSFKQAYKVHQKWVNQFLHSCTMRCSYLPFRSYLCLIFFSSVCIRLFGSNMGVLGFEFDSSLQMGGGIMFPFSGVFVCFFPYIFSGQREEYGIIM